MLVTVTKVFWMFLALAVYVLNCILIYPSHKPSRIYSQLNASHCDKNFDMAKAIASMREPLETDAVHPGLADSRYAFTYDKVDLPYNESLGVVSGWPPEKDRNVSVYIKPLQNSVVSDTSCFKLDQTRLLIIIKTAPGNTDRRKSSRESFMTHLENYPNISFIFLMGKTSDFKLHSKTRMEMERYCDILQMDFEDAYNNLTLKSISAIKFALTSGQFGNDLPDFLLLADDDSYVNIPHLWNLLFIQSLWRAESFVLIGKKLRNLPIRGGTNKWTMPMYHYNGNYYPTFLAGAGYILPRVTWHCLYKETLNLPYFFIDDIVLTGFAAERCGFRRQRVKGFYASGITIIDLKPSDILIPELSSLDMNSIHHVMTIMTK